MERTAFGLALMTTVLTTGTAGASGGAKVIEGHGEVLTVKDCGTDWSVGDNFTLRYTPSGLIGNPTNSRMTMFNSKFAQAYTTSSGRFASGASDVSTMFIGEGFGPADAQATVALTVMSATNTSTFLTLTKATVTQFGNTSGCTATFRAGLALHP